MFIFMLDMNSWESELVILISFEYVPAVIYMVVSELNERYLGSFTKEKIGAELLLTADPAIIAFLFEFATKHWV